MSVHQNSAADHDQRLIAGLLSNDPALHRKSWESLYQEYFPLIERYVLTNNGQADDARDMFQEGLLIFIKNLSTGKYRGESSIKTYLFAICRNLWLKTIEVRQREAMAITESERIVDDNDIRYLLRIRSVGILIDQLKPDCRRIITEFYVNNKSLEQLRQMFNVSNIQVMKVKKSRCLTYLKRRFAESVI